MLRVWSVRRIGSRICHVWWRLTSIGAGHGVVEHDVRCGWWCWWCCSVWFLACDVDDSIVRCRNRILHVLWDHDRRNGGCYSLSESWMRRDCSSCCTDRVGECLSCICSRLVACWGRSFGLERQTLIMQNLQLILYHSITGDGGIVVLSCLVELITARRCRSAREGREARRSSCVVHSIRRKERDLSGMQSLDCGWQLLPGLWCGRTYCSTHHSMMSAGRMIRRIRNSRSSSSATLLQEAWRIEVLNVACKYGSCGAVSMLIGVICWSWQVAVQVSSSSMAGEVEGDGGDRRTSGDCGNAGVSWGSAIRAAALEANSCSTGELIKCSGCSTHHAGGEVVAGRRSRQKHARSSGSGGSHGCCSRRQRMVVRSFVGRHQDRHVICTSLDLQPATVFLCQKSHLMIISLF